MEEEPDDPFAVAAAMLGVEDLNDVEQKIDVWSFGDSLVFDWMEHDGQVVAHVVGDWPGSLQHELPRSREELATSIFEFGQQLAWREEIARELPAFDPDDPEPDDAVTGLASFLSVDPVAMRAAIGSGWYPAPAEPWDEAGQQLLRVFSGPEPAGPLLLGVTDDTIGLCVARGQQWLAWEVEIPYGSTDLLNQLADAVVRLRPPLKRAGPRPRSRPKPS